MWYMSVCMSVCVHVCTCVCTHVCIHTCVCVHTQRKWQELCLEASFKPRHLYLGGDGVTGPPVPTSPPSHPPAPSVGFVCPILGRRFAGRGPAGWGPTWGPAVQPSGHPPLEPYGCRASSTARSGDSPHSGDTLVTTVLQRQSSAKGKALDSDQMSGPH